VDAGSVNAPAAAAAVPSGAASGLAGGDPDPFVIVVPQPALALDPVQVAGANPSAAAQHEQPAQ
jgi:hypothetical protein